MSKNIGQNIRENLICKYSQKSLDYPKKSATDARNFLNSSKRVIQKTT